MIEKQRIMTKLKEDDSNKTKKAHVHVTSLDLLGSLSKVCVIFLIQMAITGGRFGLNFTLNVKESKNANRK